MAFFKTKAVADLLGITYHRLFELIRSNKIPSPQKDSSGDYVWTEQDIERARHALAARRRPQQEVVEGAINE
jgi:DNA-binding transcriptional MerR regulator